MNSFRHTKEHKEDNNEQHESTIWPKTEHDHHIRRLLPEGQVHEQAQGEKSQAQAENGALWDTKMPRSSPTVTTPLQLPWVYKAGLRRLIVFSPVNRQGARQLWWVRIRLQLFGWCIFCPSPEGRLSIAFLTGRASGHTGAQTDIWGSCGDCSHPTPSPARPQFGWKLGLLIHQRILHLATVGLSSSFSPLLGNISTRKHKAHANTILV